MRPKIYLENLYQMVMDSNQGGALLAILFIVFYIHFHETLVDDPQGIKAFILANHCARYYYFIILLCT